MLKFLKKQKFVKIEEDQMFEEKNEIFKTETIKNIKRLIKAMNEVEDIAIQIKLGILNYENMKKEKDYFFENKFERFQYTKAFVRMFLSQILEPENLYREPEDSNIEIIEQIFRFKKHLLN